MNVYLFSAVILLLPALCTALGAAGVFLVRRADEPRTRRMLCGMAAGIMLAASVWSLLLPPSSGQRPGRCRSGWPRQRGLCWALWACCDWKKPPGG